VTIALFHRPAYFTFSLVVNFVQIFPDGKNKLSKSLRRDSLGGACIAVEERLAAREILQVPTYKFAA
jgi:hypothetical protein